MESPYKYSISISDGKIYSTVGEIKEEISTKLCRYCKIDERLYHSLINQQLWFTDPLKFNDPYDCNLNVDSSCTLEEFTEFSIIVNAQQKQMNHFELEKLIPQRYYQPEERKKSFVTMRNREIEM